MKCHPGWLAAGLLITVVLACNVSKNFNYSTSNENQSANTSSNTRRANADFYVERLYMAKDNDGKVGDSTTTFAPSDRTVHCLVTFNKAKGGTKIKATWVAENVEGRSKHTVLDSIDHTSDVDEEKTDFHVTWSRDWRPGTYRVEIYIDGILDKSIDYTVE